MLFIVFPKTFLTEISFLKLKHIPNGFAMGIVNPTISFYALALFPGESKYPFSDPEVGKK